MKSHQFGKTLAGAAIVAAVLGAALPVVANASDVEIWGRQTALGKFETKKVTLIKPGTITTVMANSNVEEYCIWSGFPPGKRVACFDVNSPKAIGFKLPPGIGYYVIPSKHNLDSMSEMFIGVDY